MPTRSIPVRARRLALVLAATALLLVPIAPVGAVPVVGPPAAAASVSYAKTIADARVAAKDLLEATDQPLHVDRPGGRLEGRLARGLRDGGPRHRRRALGDHALRHRFVSKMFVAVAVMQLVDAGKMGLDAPVVTYLPSFRMADPAYVEITVRMLLDHSAGLPGSDYANTLTTAPNPDYKARQFLAGLATSRLKTMPEFMSVYCNDCFTLAEMVVEAVSGQAYDQYVTEHIFTPLGMTHSRFPTEAYADATYAHVYSDATTKTADPQGSSPCPARAPSGPRRRTWPTSRRCS